MACGETRGMMGEPQASMLCLELAPGVDRGIIVLTRAYP